MAQIAPDDFFLHPQLFRGLLDEHGALPGGVQIEGVDVEARLALPVRCRDQQVDLQEFVAQVLGQAPDAVAAVALGEDDFFALYLGGERFGTGGWGRDSGSVPGSGFRGGDRKLLFQRLKKEPRRLRVAPAAWPAPVPRFFL